MGDWLLLLGLVLWRAGFACHIASNWRRHGLTHVPWSTLLALSAGSVVLVVWGVMHAEMAVVILSVVAGVVDLSLPGLKFRDWLATRLRVRVGRRHRAKGL